MGRVISLDKIPKNTRCTVVALNGSETMAKRLQAMGIFVGRQLRVESGGGLNPVIVSAAGSKAAIGPALASAIDVECREYRLLLTGNPNVGKSVVFSRLTGLDVVSSNFPGTTIELKSGTAMFDGLQCSVTDVPGAYSIEPACGAEEVACSLLAEGNADLILHVLDATNLERNLFFALQVLEFGKPVIFLLNKWDLAKMRGIYIDCGLLSRQFGIPCLPFVAVTGEGARELEIAVSTQLDNPSPPRQQPLSSDEKWKLIGRLSKEVQKIEHRHPSLLEQFAELSVVPVTGLPIAAAVLAGSYFLVRFLGEGLMNHVLDPLFRAAYLPAVESLVGLFSSPALSKILLGSGAMEGFGLLTTGIYVALVSVLAYVFAFYLVLGFLEDSGYLPRLAALLDRAFHKIGLHGYGSIPLLLGLGCKVPGILAARVLETRREKIIALTMVLLVAPCIPQSAMIFSLVGPLGLGYVAAVFGVLLLTGLAAGMVLNKVLRGQTPELFIEIPPWHCPKAGVLASKLRLRLKEYVLEAVPMILLGVLIIDAADFLGLLDAVSSALKYPLSSLLGLPKETASVVLLGFLRKDISIALLKPFALTPWQTVTASVFLSIYLPCLASLLVMVREAGYRDAMKIVALNLLLALSVGGLLHLAAAAF